MWGQDTDTDSQANKIRIIPTRVGTRATVPTKEDSRQDHPHACGDKNLRRFFMWDMLGSSPRVWGQGTGAVAAATMARIIPTRVGTR